MPGKFGANNSEDGAFGSTTATDKVGVFGFNQASTPPTGGGAGGAGVFGLSVSPGAAGVFGANNSAKGVGVQGNGPEAGISGFSDTEGGAGVRAHSNRANGIEGFAHNPNGNGILAINDAKTAATAHDGTPHGCGVLGVTTVPGAAGIFGANNDGTKGVGIQGNGPERGVSGFSDKGAGVVGQSAAANGVLATSTNGQGVTAFSDNDVGLFAQGGTFGAVLKGALVVGKGPGPKNPNIPRNQVDGSIVINDGGSLFLNGGGDVILGNADCAEDFDVVNAELVEAGTVMVLGEEGILEPCQSAYDKRVAGVISGAGKYKPGIVLDKQGSQPNRRPIAMLGKVYCKVDAQHGAVEIGDLLTPSPTRGHAMKAIDHQKAFGAVIGKALRPLSEGQGLIPILIALQ